MIIKLFGVKMNRGLRKDIWDYIKERNKVLPNLNYMNKYFYFIDIITNNDTYSLKDQCSYDFEIYDNEEKIIINLKNINYALIYDMAFDATIIFENKNPGATNREKYIYFIDYFKKQVKEVKNNSNYYITIPITKTYYIINASSSNIFDTPTYVIKDYDVKKPSKDFFNALTGGLINKLDEKKFIYRQNYIKELLNSKIDTIYNLNYSYSIEDLIYHSDLKQIVFQIERRVEEICEDIKDKDRTPFLQECYEIIRLIYPDKCVNEILDNTAIGAYIENANDKNNIKADIFFKNIFLGLIYNEAMDETDNHFKGNIDADIKEKYEYFARDKKNRAKNYTELADPKYIIYSKAKRVLNETKITFPAMQYKIVPVDNNNKNNEDIYNCLTGGLYGILQKRPCTYLNEYKNILLETKIIKDVKIRELLLDEDKKLVFNPKR